MVELGNGVSLAVEQEGAGPVPLVFLHGYSLSMATWTRVLPFFAGFTRIRYDLRGFGQSGRPDTGYTMRQHAADLGLLLDRLGVAKAVLIGHSLGGAIAQEFALGHPARTLAVVTSNAYARHRPPPGIDDALRARAEGFRNPDQVRALLQHAVPRYVAPANRGPADLAFFLRLALGASPVALREQLLDSYSAPALDAAAMARLPVPLLSITGAEDTVVPVAEAEAVAAAVPDSELVLVPGAGHTPMWERPDAWAAAVLDFLRRRVPGADAA